ncbi:MAG TPA: ATP-binding protein [Rhizomicrobium sp.]|nr:ATP-binding protein [Rhizomicrobium sp.]
MLESEFLIYDRPASVRQTQSARLFALALLLACLAIFPFRVLALPKISAFIAVIDTMYVLFSGIIAAVLLSLASILRSKALIALGTGFFFTGLFAGAHALTYPEVFSPAGLLGADINTATWLYLSWHTALPTAVIAYALLKNAPHRLRETSGAPVGAIFVCLAAAAILAVAVISLATAGAHLVTGVLHFGLPQANSVHYFAMLLTGVGIALLWLGPRSVLDIGLMLTLWALLTESIVILPGAARFSVGWYSGRLMGLLSGLFVLLMLLIEMGRLYGRMALLIAVQKREQENRRMVGEAVGAFIAHELRQPLASMMLHAGTAKHLCAEDDGRLTEVLDELVQDGRRVHEIVESTRAAVAKDSPQKSLADINRLVRDTLRMISHELRGRGIKIRLDLDDRLPPVLVNPVQMQQVFVNLFLNAVDAMSEVKQRPRLLAVQTSRGDAMAVVRVQDSGRGIRPDDLERVFDAFFTTKTHGAGIGLSICRSVVNAHGGTIQVSSQEPFGAIFEISLPAGAVQAEPVFASQTICSASRHGQFNQTFR